MKTPKPRCRWTRKTPDGTPGIMGPLEELRTGRVTATQGDSSVDWNVGTPLFHQGKWVAYVLLYIKTQDAGSWWTDNWRLDCNLPHDEKGANERPRPQEIKQA